MKHFMLFYTLSEDYLERRPQYRTGHLRLAWEAHEARELVLAGALTDPTDTALLLFQGDSPDVAAKFARSDPYVTSGIVSSWRVREWLTVVGAEAASPVRPNR